MRILGCLGSGEDLFKRGVVSGLLKQRQSPDVTIQDVIGEVSRSEAQTAWHAGLLRNRRESVEQGLPILCFPPANS